MAAFRLRIMVDELEDVFRDIEVKSKQKFKDLHEAIVNSFDIKGNKNAAFFTSNARWQKLNEVTLGKGSKFDNPIDGLTTTIGTILPDATNMLIYVNDGAPQYTFLIEIEKTSEAKADKTYPRCTKKKGVLPNTLAASFTDDIFDESIQLHIDDILEEPEDDDFF